jgi:hypothetical protein
MPTLKVNKVVEVFLTSVNIHALPTAPSILMLPIALGIRVDGHRPLSSLSVVVLRVWPQRPVAHSPQHAELQQRGRAS